MIASFQSRLPVSGSSIGWWYVIPIRKSVWRTSPSTGECEWYECPCVGEWVVARLSHGDEHDCVRPFCRSVHLSRSRSGKDAGDER